MSPAWVTVSGMPSSSPTSASEPRWSVVQHDPIPGTSVPSESSTHQVAPSRRSQPDHQAMHSRHDRGVAGSPSPGPHACDPRGTWQRKRRARLAMSMHSSKVSRGMGLDMSIRFRTCLVVRSRRSVCSRSKSIAETLIDVAKRSRLRAFTRRTPSMERRSLTPVTSTARRSQCDLCCPFLTQLPVGSAVAF